MIFRFIHMVRLLLFSIVFGVRKAVLLSHAENILTRRNKDPGRSVSVCLVPQGDWAQLWLPARAALSRPTGNAN